MPGGFNPYRVHNNTPNVQVNEVTGILDYDPFPDYNGPEDTELIQISDSDSVRDDEGQIGVNLDDVLKATGVNNFYLK